MTESRIAIALSCASLIFTGWQAVVASKANRMNEDDLSLEVSHETNISQHCDTYAYTKSKWTIVIVNRSNQAVYLRDIGIRQLTPIERPVRLNPFDSPKLKIPGVGLPATLDAKKHLVLNLDLSLPVSNEFIAELVKSGICIPNTLVAPISKEQAIAKPQPAVVFTSWGWPMNSVSRKELGVRVEVQTSSDQVFVGYGFALPIYNLGL